MDSSFVNLYVFCPMLCVETRDQMFSDKKYIFDIWIWLTKIQVCWWKESDCARLLHLWGWWMHTRRQVSHYLVKRRRRIKRMTMQYLLTMIMKRSHEWWDNGLKHVLFKQIKKCPHMGKLSAFTCHFLNFFGFKVLIKNQDICCHLPH